MNQPESSPAAKKGFRSLLIVILVLLFAVILCAAVNFYSGTDEPIEEASAGTPVPTSTATPTPTVIADIPPASEQNDLLKIAVNAQGTDEKVCYLTFDDGPTKEVTPAVLEALKRYNVKATFFMLGKMIERNPDLAKQVYDEGHLLANHSYSHSYEELYPTSESFLREIQKTQDLIQTVTGQEPFKLIRFPGGGHNAGAYGAQKQQYKLLLQEKGYYFADWNSLNGDAEGGTRSAAQLLARIQETSGAKHLVVLMHDAATKKTTAEALPSIIEYLQGKGFVFKRMDEIQYYGGENIRPAPDLSL